MTYAARLSARMIIVGTLALAVTAPATPAAADGGLKERIGTWAKRGKMIAQQTGYNVLTSLERAGFEPAKRLARTKRVAAFDKMLDRIWAQTVKRESKGTKGLAGSIKIEGNRVIKTVEPEMDLRKDFGWKVEKPEMRKLVDQEVATQRAVAKLIPGFTPQVFSYDRNTLTFAMELVPGKHLNEITKADLNPGALSRFRHNLSRVHRAGIGHGDIKPANIMIVGGEMKLIDWGTGRQPVGAGGKETVMDHFLRRTMGHPGAVDLISYDRRAMRRVYQAVANLPEAPAAAN